MGDCFNSFQRLRDSIVARHFCFHLLLLLLCRVRRRISERGGRLQYGEEFVGFVSCPLFPNQLLHYNTYTIPSAEGP